MFLLGESKGVSVLKDPFKQDKIKSISFDYAKIMFEKAFSWTARVRFTNGNTDGAQSFEVRDDESKNAFEEITRQVQSFINSL